MDRVSTTASDAPAIVPALSASSLARGSNPFPP
jgi:hypothetical protein